MPRERLPPEPAPPEAAAALDAALTVSGFGLASLFVMPGNRMSDPDVVAAGVAISRSRRPPVSAEAPQAKPGDTFTEAMRCHLDGMNHRLLNLNAGLHAIDSSMAAIISDHLDAIGLDDIIPQINQS